MLFGYARVSTIDQNPDLQLDALRIAGCERIFTDKSSGASQNRPQFKEVFNYLRKNDVLVIWKLSRLARSLKQIIAIVSDMDEKGIGLRVLTQNIDTTTPEGRPLFHMIAAFDEFQREIIVENTRAGLVAAHKRGRKGGRPKKMNIQDDRKIEAMLKDTINYPFVSDVIKEISITRTTFYKYFPPDRIQTFRKNHV